MKHQKAKKVAIKCYSYRVIYLFMDVPVVTRLLLGCYWWNYFLGMLTAAYKEFEDRVGAITSARGAKREMVRRAFNRLPERFKIADLRQACPGVSYPTLQRALADLRKAGKVRCLGRGPDAEWQKEEG